MIKAMKDFQIPMRVEVDKDTLSPTFGRFTTEAFERGFGTTVGNPFAVCCCLLDRGCSHDRQD